MKSKAYAKAQAHQDAVDLAGTAAPVRQQYSTGGGRTPPTAQIGEVGVMTEIVPGYATCAEAAKMTGYNAEHIRRLARSGAVRAVKAGPAWLVNMSSLRAYMADPAHGPYSEREAKYE